MTPAPSESTGEARRLVEGFDLERLAKRLQPLASPVRLRLLRYLTHPHYLEEVGSHLGLSRQAARKHVDQLVAIGVVKRQPGLRDTGAVTEYVLNRQSLFLVYDEFEQLGSLRSDARTPDLGATLAGPQRRTAGGSDLGPCLTVLRGPDTGKRVPLTSAKPCVLGRDARCEIALDYDPYASNRHAEIRGLSAEFRLIDLSSTNGTLLNWKPIPAGAEVPLRHGDLVGVGKTLFLFWDAAPVKR